ncbi:Aste57867_2157 [Aphanomyces stellatus]|uniref:Aste57867_1924 protein n=1 Tax=Aphanomyces stellatus TaxID=120398 RepID=A0A485K6U3_9STRA|nr:hypothetical protein As57867_002152 [Aphanomyces stellatus]KAF0718046.1 hypothetical protein As57867_001922 [Aphanomyces stellatus]KAF0718062.1 hypothetical protein As57867_001938 [Aphanomyces stellatus]VFT79129.1 Aste57867_1924 [Aphanomyces stellatus]VFT79145.1 Aste57867_1940 [Aphanomyces stellatus]
MAAARDTGGGLWTLVEPCLLYLRDKPSPSRGTNNGTHVCHVIASLKQHGARALADVTDAELVWAALDLLLRNPLHPSTDYLFPPALYSAVVALGRDVDVPDLDKLRAVLHSAEEPTRSRFFLVLRVLHEVWSDVADAATRFAPLVFRDGHNAFRSIQHVEDLPASTRCLGLALQHFEYIATPTNVAMDQPITVAAMAIFDALVLDTVRTVLFAPAVMGPFVITSVESKAAVKVQAVVRGWQSRQWSGLATLYGKGGPRREYLALTKRVLNWPVVKLCQEKARLKARLRGLDGAFRERHGREPHATEKESHRPLYEQYHFFNLMLDYQRTASEDDEHDPALEEIACEPRERIEARKERVQMRLLVFQRHFELCCGDKVQNEEDYGHVLPHYTHYKKLSAMLTPNQRDNA